MGAYNEDLFKKSFEFIGELKQKERKQLETAVEKEKDPLRKDKLKMLLQRQVHPHRMHPVLTLCTRGPQRSR